MELRFRLWVGLSICLALVAVMTTAVQARYHHTPGSRFELTQYANIAPLPGAGVALDAKGKPDGRGAFYINIPAAYTPGWGYVSASAYNGAHIGGPTNEFSNGSGVFAAGFFNKLRVYMSGMAVSHILGESLALSGQAELVNDTQRTPAVAIGKQDMLGKETDGMSPYFVLTKSLQLKSQPLFATLGYGGGRFRNKPFGGLSAPLGNCFNLALENDGFQFNTGLGWRPGGRTGKLTVLAAFNGKCGWLLGFNLAGVFGSR